MPSYSSKSKQQKNKTKKSKGRRSLQKQSKSRSQKNKTKNRSKSQPRISENNLPLFLETYNNERSELNIIGSGGQGIVYEHKNIEDSVFKVSSKEEGCRQWDIEVNKINHLKDSNINEKYVKLVEFKNFHKDLNTNTCILELEKVTNPLDKTTTVIQPLFGENETFKHDPKRGYYISIDLLIREHDMLLIDLKNIIVDLAKFLANMHFKAKMDGNDIEFFLSFDKQTKKPIIIVADFDLVENITNYDKDIIDNIIWGMTNIEFIPLPFVSKGIDKLFKIFSDNYIETASKYNKKEVAEQIITRIIDENNL